MFGRPYLLFANKRDIRLVEVSQRRPNPRTTLVVRGLEDADVLDFVLKENKICWTEVKKGTISCSDINAGRRGRMEKEVVVDTGLMNPEGLACDWVNRKIYWTDSETRRIEVVDLEVKEDGRRERKVIVWEDLDLPRAIVLAPKVSSSILPILRTY